MAEQKQTALVTAASSGIGGETAIGLAAKGFEVIAAARTDEDYEPIMLEKFDLMGFTI